MSLHRRLGHIHITRCFEVARKLGMDVSGLASDLVSKHCDVCAKAKLRKLPMSTLAPGDVNIAPGELSAPWHTACLPSYLMWFSNTVPTPWRALPPSRQVMWPMRPLRVALLLPARVSV